MSSTKRPLKDRAGKFEVERLDFTTFERINDKLEGDNQSSSPPHVAVNGELPIGNIVTNKATGEQVAVFVVADKSERRVEVLSIDRRGDYGLGSTDDGHLVLGLEKGDLDKSIEVTKDGLDKKGIRVPLNFLEGLVASERLSSVISKAHLASEEKRKSEIKDSRDIHKEITRIEKHFKQIRTLKESEGAMENPIQIKASMDPTSVLYVEYPEPNLVTRDSIKKELNNNVPFSNGEHELKDPEQKYLVSEFKSDLIESDEVRNSLLDYYSSNVENGVRVREKGSQAGFVVATVVSYEDDRSKPLLNIRGVTLDKKGNILETGDDALKTIGLYQDAVIYANTEGVARSSYYENRPKKSIYSQYSEKETDEYRVNSIRNKVSAGHMNELISKKTLTHEHAKRVGIIEGQPLFDEGSVDNYANSTEYKLRVQKMQDDFIREYQEHLVQNYSLDSDEAIQLTKKNTPLEILNGIKDIQAILAEEGVESDIVAAAREFADQELMITGHPIYDDLDDSLNTDKDFNFPGSSIPEEKELSDEVFLSDAYNISERDAAKIVKSVGAESFNDTMRNGKHTDPEDAFTQLLRTSIENARIKNDMDKKVDDLQKNPLDVPVSSANENKIAGMLLSDSYTNLEKENKLDVIAKAYSNVVWGSDLPPKVDLEADYGSKFAWKEQASLILDKKTMIYELADAKKKESVAMQKQLELQKQEVDLLVSRYLATVKEANKERVLAYVELTGTSNQLDQAKSIFKEINSLEKTNEDVEKEAGSVITKEDSEFAIDKNKESIRNLKDNLSAITYNLEDYDIALEQKDDPEAKQTIKAFTKYVESKKGDPFSSDIILNKRGELFRKADRLREDAQESKIILDDMHMDTVIAIREADIVKHIAGMDRLDRFAKTVLSSGKYQDYKEAKDFISKMNTGYEDGYSTRSYSMTGSDNANEKVRMVKDIEKPIRDYDLSKADLSKIDDDAFLSMRKTRDDVRLRGNKVREQLESMTFNKQVKDLRTMFDSNSQERLSVIDNQNREFIDELASRPEPSKNENDISIISKYISQISFGNALADEIYNAGVTRDDIADSIHKALVERGVDISKEDIKATRESFVSTKDDLFVAFDMNKYPTVQILSKNDDKGLQVIDYTPKNMASDLGLLDKNELSSDGHVLASVAKERLSQIEKHSKRLKTKFELESDDATIVAHTFPEQGEFEEFVLSIEEDNSTANPDSEQNHREAVTTAVEYAKAQHEKYEVSQDSVKDPNNIEINSLERSEPSRNKRRSK